MSQHLQIHDYFLFSCYVCLDYTYYDIMLGFFNFPSKSSFFFFIFYKSEKKSTIHWTVFLMVFLHRQFVKHWATGLCPGSALLLLDSTCRTRPWSLTLQRSGSWTMSLRILPEIWTVDSSFRNSALPFGQFPQTLNLPK